MPSPEVNEQWLTAILDTIDEGIHAVDTDGVTIFYNGAAARMDGLAAADVIGRHVLSIFPSLGQDTSTLLQVLRTGEAIHNRPQTYTNFLGVTVHTVNATLPIRVGGRVVGALEIAKDLTQVRRLSDQVLALQAQVVGSRRSRRRDTSTHTATYTFADLLTRDARMEDVKRRAERAAKTASPVLVYGETGTGKELLVQAIHNASPRAVAPFLALNCAALPGALLEGILFGTVRGSFTGSEDRPGLFELADGGTLFLDEIQSMPLDLQAKLLRVLQEGEVMRVGDSRVRRLDVRVIVAMNDVPEAAAAAGQLRRDLYFRINVVRLDLPALRERPGDIALLTDHFVSKWNARLGTQVTGVSPRVRRLFDLYPWPGNVRELENAIEASLNLVAIGEIDGDVLPAHLRERLDDLADPDRSAGLSGAASVALGWRLPAASGAAPDSQSTADPRPAGSTEAVADSRPAPNPRTVPGSGAVPAAASAAADRERDWVAAFAALGLDALWADLAVPTAAGRREASSGGAFAVSSRAEQGAGFAAAPHAGFAAPSRDAAAVPPWPTVQAGMERVIVARALSGAAGNVAQAAKKLGIPRQTLQYRLRQLGL